MAHSNIFKFVLFGIFICGVGIVILNVASYGRRQAEHDVNPKNNPLISSGQLSDKEVFSRVDLKRANKSRKTSDKQHDELKVKIQKYKITLKGEKLEKVIVREAGEGDNHILLLHGRKLTSDLWTKTGTLQLLASWGYRAYAVDIPFEENNSSSTIKVEWLKKVISKLHLSNAVIISPSLSGRLTIPYMFELKQSQSLIRGFVYMAPVGTKQYKASQYEKINIPTLIVHGEKDKEFMSAVELLKNMPKSQLLTIKNGSHTAYAEFPTQFHEALQQFLKSVYQPNDKTVVSPNKKKAPLPSERKLKRKKKE